MRIVKTLVSLYIIRELFALVLAAGAMGLALWFLAKIMSMEW